MYYWINFFNKFFFMKQEVTEELKTYQTVIKGLHNQAANLGEQVFETSNHSKK